MEYAKDLKGKGVFDKAAVAVTDGSTPFPMRACSHSRRHVISANLVWLHADRGMHQWWVTEVAGNDGGCQNRANKIPTTGAGASQLISVVRRRCRMKQISRRMVTSGSAWEQLQLRQVHSRDDKAM
ncbi:hypothetical protein ACLOJK_003370 [Asimina triloba]